jgi:hypothetical protein
MLSRPVMREPTDLHLNQADLAAIEARGLSLEEVARQRDLLAGTATYRTLERPATVGDGVRVLSAGEIEACLSEFAQAALAGRYLSFVPASGAASRMFKTLLEAKSSGRALDRQSLESSDAPEDLDVLKTFSAIDRLAIEEELGRYLDQTESALQPTIESGNYAPLVDALLDPGALDLPAQPKGLLPFHRYPNATRTAFEEHLREAGSLLADRDGHARVHFTVSPQHQSQFEMTLSRVAPAIQSTQAVAFRHGFSTQAPSTDTIALDANGELFRTGNGEILFRPGGHGSLLRNLDELDGDFVFIKNIDNIVPDDRRDLILHWRRILGGLLAQLQRKTLQWRDQLQRSPTEPAVLEAAGNFLDKELGLGLDRPVSTLLEEVASRPMRVCGVVGNTGDPGGGPFWVRAHDGSISRQIVETAEINPDDREQARNLERATHFNPTDMVCALRDAAGRPFALGDFVDTEAVFVAKKSSEGRELFALEHPGLWNGSMAGWTTIFVEVPRETFQPVKSLLDLLGTGHAPSP